MWVDLKSNIFIFLFSMMVLAMVIIGGYMMFRYKMYVALMLCMEKVSM